MDFFPCAMRKSNVFFFYSKRDIIGNWKFKGEVGSYALLSIVDRNKYHTKQNRVNYIYATLINNFRKMPLEFSRTSTDATVLVSAQF